MAVKAANKSGIFSSQSSFGPSNALDDNERTEWINIVDTALDDTAPRRSCAISSTE